MAAPTTPYSTARDIAAAVRSGRASAVDIVRDHLDRIAALEPTLHAFQVVRRDAALAEAAEVDLRPDRATLPLAGVPIAVKDNFEVAGVPTRHGSAATPTAPARADDELVSRLRAAGCIVVGTTRMPELAIWGITASAAFGVTRNPWDPGRDPGGSTGGGAVAVAAGMAALALGSDGGGSLRIPSAYCGVLALKPTAGRLPLPGGLIEHWYGLSVSGAITRTAADAAAVLAVLGNEARAPDLPELEPLPAELQVAVSLRSPSPIGRPDRHQRAAVQVAVAELRASGHTAVLAEPPYPLQMLQWWVRRWHAGIAQDVQRMGLEPARLEPRSRVMARKGRRLQRLGGPRPGVGPRWQERVLRWLDHPANRYDVLLTPTVARGPVRASALLGRRYLTTFLAQGATVPYTGAWNLAGLPAAAVPVGVRDGRPMSVQLVGRPGSEPLLLALAALLERPATPVVGGQAAVAS